MVDIVTSQVLENGASRLVMKFTNLSDGTGEMGVVKVDATDVTYANRVQGNVMLPGTSLKITGLWYDVASMGLRLQWAATVATDILVLGGFGQWGFRDLRGGFQGLINPKAAGATGSIQFSTIGAAANSSYSVILEMIKGVPQS
ncbi:MAG TPA: hypothetical protein VMV33_17140 [Rhodocyclaceae bacterium]|nr:hypothetical protein [Rhodocyclaceae bacterium]